MRIQTIGHASLLISADDGAPLLLTDPWLAGSTYWHSWWLENYPDADEFARLRKVEYCYITHEHPDHFHLRSLKRLGNGPQYLSPMLPERGIVQILTEMNMKAEALRSMTWRQLTDDLRVLSVWLWTDDSILLIDTPTALILNLNDTRPPWSFIRAAGRFRAACGKPLVMLSSYSPASVVNSFRRGSDFLTVKRKQDYVDYVNALCDSAQADYFMPFASQATFLRSDSKWANEFKVTHEDLQAGWKSRTRLLPPYCTLNLNDWSFSAVARSSYRASDEPVTEQIAEQEAMDGNCALSDDEIAACQRQLNATWFVYAMLYPQGILFDTRAERFLYRPFRRSLIRVDDASEFAFRLTVPAQSLKDAINFGHLGDLGIAMFSIVQLKSVRNPWLVYGFFVLETFKDYRHLSSVGAFLRWSRSAVRSQWHMHRPIPKC